MRGRLVRRGSWAGVAQPLLGPGLGTIKKTKGDEGVQHGKALGVVSAPRIVCGISVRACRACAALW